MVGFLINQWSRVTYCLMITSKFWGIHEKVGHSVIGYPNHGHCCFGAGHPRGMQDALPAGSALKDQLLAGVLKRFDQAFDSVIPHFFCQWVQTPGGFLDSPVDPFQDIRTISEPAT